MRILVIDDLDVTAFAIARALNDGGFVVDTSPVDPKNPRILRDIKWDIQSAFFWLATHEYSAIVTDVNLPKVSGLEGVEYLRKRHSGPIVACTGFDLTYEEQCLFDGYIRKPLETSVLAPLLRSLLRSSML